MDIKRFAVEETSVLELRDAADVPMVDDVGKSVTVTLYGPGSKPYAKAQAAQQNRMIDKLKRKGKSDQSAEDKAREQAEFLAGCTKEFSANFEYEKLTGEALHKAVYADTSVGFIAEQVGKHLGEWGNFTKGSPKP
jgi:hypothetical protein